LAKLTYPFVPFLLDDHVHHLLAMRAMPKERLLVDEVV
jgi:hypothetical protein